MMKGKAVFLVCVFGLLSTGAVFSQEYYRVLELQRPRMNGADVLNLQRRLLFLGFTDIGEADGIYGPKAEGVIKNIQKFAGYAEYDEQNGKVDLGLWNFIFLNTAFNNDYLKLISVVSKYDRGKLKKIETSYDYEYQADRINYTLYYSNDGKLKILDIVNNRKDFFHHVKEYYFATADQYIAIYLSGADGEEGSFQYGAILRNNSNMRRVDHGEVKDDYYSDENIFVRLDDGDLLELLYRIPYK